MRAFRLVALSVALVPVLGAPSGSAQSVDCRNLQTTGIPGRVYILARSEAQQSGAISKWVPLPQIVQIGDSHQDIQLAYLLPSTKGANDSGSLIIKIARQSSIRQTEQGASNLRVRLLRPAFTSTCKGRSVWDYLGGTVGPPVSFDVGVADYIYYHKTDVDGSMDIYRFHVDYRDKNGNCISTDDKKNGNRQQFLFGNRIRDQGLIVANIKNNLGLVARAYGAPEYVSDALKDTRTRELMTEYLNYSRLETQLHQYKTVESTCVPFIVGSPEKGESVSVRLNDLEQRNAAGQFLAASARQEKRLSFQIK
jgi:hypothetical protein